MVFIFLLPVFAHAAETKEANCNSGEDCFDKAMYLLFDKNDYDKYKKYIVKGCNYNHVLSCMGAMAYEGDKGFRKAVKLDVPFALFIERIKQDDFGEYVKTLRQKKNFFDTDAGANKMLNFSKDFLKICKKQKELLKSTNGEGYRFLIKTSDTLFTEIVNHISGGRKYYLRVSDDINENLLLGLSNLSQGECDYMEKTIKLLEHHIADKKKYDDL